MNLARLVVVIAAAGAAPALGQTGAPPAATPPAQTAAPAPRPAPPTRDPNSPGFVTAKELPDGAVPPPDEDGNFIIGPTHTPAPEMAAQEGVPQGTIHNFTMSSADSRIYPGIAREQGTFGTVDPRDPAKLVVTTSHPAPYTRRVAVYVPKQYVPGTPAPFIVGADGPDQLLFAALDNLIAQKRVPVMIAISIGNGSGDAQGSQRGLEYDTMSARYAEFVESEVLPLVEKQYNVTLTKDPEGRATMGCSSGGSAALIMAWYRPDLYHRVLTYSGTYVNQQWPPSADTPHGAWEFHERLISEQPAEADPPLDGSGRQGPVQSEHHARRDARLGRRQREHGQGPRRERVSLSIRLRPQCRPLRPRREAADAAGGAGVAVERLSRRRDEDRALSSRQAMARKRLPPSSPQENLLRPIGVISSSITDRSAAPRQGSEGAPDAWLDVFPWAQEGLQGLAAGDEIIVVTWFHRADRDVFIVRPRSDPRNPLTGVFATRSPDRPNPLGLHPVVVRAIEGNRLRIGPIEAIDGTPVVDIKPVLK